MEKEREGPGVVAEQQEAGGADEGAAGADVAADLAAPIGGEWVPFRLSEGGYLFSVSVWRFG